MQLRKPSNRRLRRFYEPLRKTCILSDAFFLRFKFALSLVRQGCGPKAFTILFAKYHYDYYYGGKDGKNSN